MKLLLLEAAAAAVEAHAREAYPEECCGLLLGPLDADFGAPDSAARADEARRLANAWEGGERGRRYALDPLAFAKIERALTGTGRGVLGIYHSHPDAPAWPSPFDLERAWPSYAYLILSVRGGQVEDARVWRRTEDGRAFGEGTLKRLAQACFAKARAGE